MEALKSENSVTSSDQFCEEDAYAYDYVKPVIGRNLAYGVSATSDVFNQQTVYETIDIESKNAPQVYHLPNSPRIKNPGRFNQKDPVKTDDIKQSAPLVPPPPPEIYVEEATDSHQIQHTDVKKNNLDVQVRKEKRQSRRITAEQLDVIQEMMSPITIGVSAPDSQQQPYYDDIVHSMYSSQQSEPDEMSRGGAYVNMHEVESTYDTISDGEDVYDTIDDPPKKKLYYNLESAPPLPPKPVKMQHQPNNLDGKKPAIKPRPMKRLIRKGTLGKVQLVLVNKKIIDHSARLN